MSWFGKRRSRSETPAGQVSAGRQASPGLALFTEMLGSRPLGPILDLGPTSTENLEFFSDRASEVAVGDLFHTVGKRGQRSELYLFDDADEAELPDKPARFVAVLLWDLLHYFPLAERRHLAERLIRRLEPGALVLVHASSVSKVPPTPIQFKIADREHLDYVVGDDRVPSPGLSTREVERALVGFEPIRLFQLRNGYMEMVFRWPGVDEDD